MYREAKILVIDDNPVNTRVISMILGSEGYKNIAYLTRADNPSDWAGKNSPDIILLDFGTDTNAGLNILRSIRRHNCLKNSPIIIFTAHDDQIFKKKIFEYGAQDYIKKPVTSYELTTRINNFLKLKSDTESLRQTNTILEAKANENIKEIIRTLGRAAELKDNDTGDHVLRVSIYSSIIAEGLKFPQNQLDLIFQASQMHDIGKIGIPDSILHKKGKLTPEERSVMQTHCMIGASIFIPYNDSEKCIADKRKYLEIIKNEESPLIRISALIALTHHERWDGTGYPLGLAGEEIPIEGRIVAVADVFDALNTKRPYKKAYSIDESWNMVKKLSGNHFDPKIVKEIFNLVEVMSEIQDMYQETAPADLGLTLKSKD